MLCSLILLLPTIDSSEGLFRFGTSISKHAWFLVSFAVNISSTSLALPALIVLRTLANLLEQFLKNFSFLLSFFSISNNNILSIFFLNFVIYLELLKCCSIFSVLTHKWCVYYRLNGFKLNGMIFCNLISGDLDQRCKAHSFLPNFSTSSSPFTMAFTLQV